MGFDLDTLTIRGSTVPVVERVVTKGTGAANFAMSRDGSLVYESGDIAGGAERTLVWVDRQGREEVIAAAPKRAYTYPRISPDGTRVALDIRDQQNDIWVWDLTRPNLMRLTLTRGSTAQSSGRLMESSCSPRSVMARCRCSGRRRTAPVPPSG